jgi:hypothetical protein
MAFGGAFSAISAFTPLTKRQFTLIGWVRETLGAKSNFNYPALLGGLY